MASSNDEANTHLTAGVCARKPLSTTCFGEAVQNARADGRGSRSPASLSRVGTTGEPSSLWPGRGSIDRVCSYCGARAPPRMNGNTAGAAAPVDQGRGKENEETHGGRAANFGRRVSTLKEGEQPSLSLSLHFFSLADWSRERVAVCPCQTPMTNAMSVRKQAKVIRSVPGFPRYDTAGQER